MDPSGTSACGQVQPTTEQSYASDSTTVDGSKPQKYHITPVAEDVDRGTGPDRGLQPLEADLGKQKTDEFIGTPQEQRGWRKIIRNFTPSWFSVVMGTGIVSILLHNLPYNGTWLYWISVVMFALNALLFSVSLLISILRYTIYPEIWLAMIRHPVQSLFLGTFPMGLATIINMIIFVCVPVWGIWTVYFAWALWWLDAVLAVFTCFYLPFVIMYFHRVELSSMTAAWLLPIVAPIVAAATGGIVASALPKPDYIVWTVIVSYILWGTGVPLAMTVLVIYFQRLTVYNIPPREVIVSVFLPLGPLGQGGFAIMQLGKVASQVFPKSHTLDTTTGTGNSGAILYVVGWLVALIMWGYGIVWLFFALASISRSKFPFNVGWWGFTFPLGVFTVSTTTLGKEIPSTFFNVLGTIFSVAVTLLWIMVAYGTLHKLATGQLLFAPCLKDLEDIKQEQAAKHFGEKARKGT